LGSSQTLVSRREIALAVLILASLAALVVASRPIAQDPQYHRFADSRTFFGVTHFANVVSGLPFMLVGVLGLRLCFQRRMEGARRAWAVFFAGALLVSIGSGYYHSAPSDATLVWDRLPMTIAFMGLFVALVSEHIMGDLERKWLLPAVLVGIASVVWWHHTGDLRPYIAVQLAPLLAIPVVLAAYRGRYTHRAYLLYGLLCYVLAKAVEVGDDAVLAGTSGAFSGHTLKHLLAALAMFFVYRMLRLRQKVTPHGERQAQPQQR
jgi:hypothetical protein